MTTLDRTAPYTLPAHGWIPEPYLAFHPERAEDRHPHPLEGLVQFGPYSRSLLTSLTDPIRVAVVGPSDLIAQLNNLFKEIESAHRPRERTQYLVDFPGFSRAFRTRVVLVPDLRFQLGPDVDGQIDKSDQPHMFLAEQLARAVAALRSRRADFDVLLIALPERWNRGFTGPGGDDFDLHDFLKALTASEDIPAQIIREKRAFSYACRCSVMWRLGIALYCKAGGIPWKLADTDPEAAFIGLSYALQTDAEGNVKFVTCCSQVFDADGTGLEFIAYDVADAYIERKNPFLSRSEMRRVMSRSLSLYQQRHGGHPPKRVVIHKSTEFKPEEIDGCFDSWQAAESLELVQVQKDTPWRGVHFDASHKPGRYPCHRGTYMLLSGYDSLLWTQGNVPSLTGHDYFKEGKGTPSPLLLRRFAGHGPFYGTCNAILGLTKMDWNNDALYDRLPVTLGYAKVLAKTVRRMPKLARRPYQFRFFM